MLPIFQEFSLLFVLLGFGYLGYVTAYAGLRRGHKAFDAFFISLAFGAVAYIPFYVFEFVQLPSEFPAWRARLILFAIAIGMSIFAGLVWGKWARAWWHGFLRVIGLQYEGGRITAWDELLHSGLEVTKVSVHLKNGTILYMQDRWQLTDTEWKGLLLGADGSVVMVVDAEEKDGKTVKREYRSERYGTRFTHIPADQIQRVEVWTRRV